MEKTIVVATLAGEIEVKEIDNGRTGKYHGIVTRFFAPATLKSENGMLTLNVVTMWSEGWKEASFTGFVLAEDYSKEENPKWNFSWESLESLGFEIDMKDLKVAVDAKIAEVNTAKEAEKRAKEKAARYESYVNSPLASIKTALEGKGYDVKMNITREEYAEKGDSLSLIISKPSLPDVIVKASYNYRNNFEVSHHNDKVGWTNKESRASKVVKLVDAVDEVFESVARRLNTLEAEIKRNASDEALLESILGVKVVKSSEYHSNGMSGRNYHGWHTTYFSPAVETAAKNLKITTGKEYNKETKDYDLVIRINGLPTTKDHTLVKAIFDLYNK
jgi:hypothetical protein